MGPTQRQIRATQAVRRAAPPGWQRDPVTGVLTPDGALAEPEVVALPLVAEPDRSPAMVVVLAPLLGLVLWGLLARWLF